MSCFLTVSGQDANPLPSMERALAAKKLSTMEKTFFQKWQDEDHGYTNLSTFQTLIMQAYQHADGNNRALLEKIYPKWFTDPRPGQSNEIVQSTPSVPA